MTKVEWVTIPPSIQKDVVSSFRNLRGDTSMQKNRNLAIKPWTPYLFIAPALLVIAIMVFFPLFYGFRLSLTNMSMRHFVEGVRIVGFDNFKEIFMDPDFYAVFGRTIVWTVVNVVFHVVIGLWLATLLNRKLPGKSIFRLLLIIPWAIPEYIAVLSWYGLFNSQYGAINIALRNLGMSTIPWLSDPNLTFVAAIIVNIWLGFPFMMMICLGGLQSIPTELYEAADIDGATSWQKFRNITLPLLKPVLVPATVLGAVWTFNKLNVIYILTRTTADSRVHIMVTKVYRAAFDYYRYGYAAAFSVVIFFILLLFAYNFIKAMKGTEEVY